MSSPRSALLTPAAIGLSGGMILGALYLAIRAIMLSTADCPAGMSAEDCRFESEVAAEMSRFFYFFAMGLMLTGIGILVLFRPKKEGAS